MIQLTEFAAMALHETLDAVLASPDQGLRLKREGNRLVLKMDTPGTHDQTILHQNRLVLIIDLETRVEIGNAIVDVEPSMYGPYLVLRNWNKVALN
jgi:hypothetical protein